MHFPTLLVITLAVSVTAKGHNETTKAISENAECREMSRLAKIVDLTSNTTKLDEITKNNATKVTEIQAQASEASIKLSTLQSNTTLISYCAVVDAQAVEENQCQETFILQRFVAFAANSTAVATATDNNTTKIAHIQLQASSAAAKLETLTSNSTLQAACSAVKQKDECQAMNGLAKFVNVVNNATELAKLAHGNATREQEIKDMATKVQTKLTAMEGNATFVAACNAISQTEKGTESSTTESAAASSSAVKKSGAAIIRNAGLSTMIVPTIAVTMLGMFLL